MFTTVSRAVAQCPEAVVVPRTAVITIDGQPTCMVVSKDGLVESRPIQVGLRSATEVETTSGLTAGEPVISANASAFKTGMKVEAVAAKSGKAGGLRPEEIGRGCAR